MIKLIMLYTLNEHTESPWPETTHPETGTESVRSNSAVRLSRRPGHHVKRDTATGRFLDVKTTDKTPFKGVRREKK